MRLSVITVSFVFALAGCAASVKRGADQSTVRVPAESSGKVVLNMSGPLQSTSSDDWEPFKGLWRGSFRRQLDALGIAFDTQEGVAKATGEPGTLLNVSVDDFRYLSTGTRYGFGAMTGNAFIESRIVFLDLASGARFGQQAFNTSSSAWEGVFSAMTDKQVDALVKEVVGEIARARMTGTGGATGVPAATPLTTPSSKAIVPAQASGKDSYAVTRLFEVRACAAQPMPRLTGSGAGFETYAIPCDKGEVLLARCEMGNCRVLR